MKLQTEHIEALKGDVLELQEKADEPMRQDTPQAPPASTSPDVLPHFIIHSDNVSVKAEQSVTTGLPAFARSDIAVTGAGAVGSGVAATRAVADPILASMVQQADDNGLPQLRYLDCRQGKRGCRLINDTF